MICTFLFDWNSFWINIIVGAIYFVISILVSIWLIPRFTLRLIRKKNKKYLVGKLSALIQELCEFLIDSPFKERDLNREHLNIFTKKSDLNNYRFVGLSVINVFSKIVYPKIVIVILEFFEKTEPNQAYKILTEEYERLKIFRLEIERILTNHSLYISEDVILKTSDLCLEIRDQEIKYKINLVYDQLLIDTNEVRNGVFGYGELTSIYKKVFNLLKQLVSLHYFEYSVELKK